MLIMPAGARAQATTSTGLKISPLKTIFSAKPGDSVRGTISVQNVGSASVNAAVEINDFTASDDLSGAPKLLIGSNNAKYGLQSWLTSPKTLQIPAGKTVEYAAVFAVPKSAATRTYFAAVRFTDSAASTTEGKTPSVASLVFISVNSPVATVAISTLDFTKLASEKPNGVFNAQLKNSGEGLYQGKLSLVIADSSGKTVQELEPDAAGSILPETSRKFSFTPKTALPPAKLTASLRATADSGSKEVAKDITIDLSPPPAVAAANQKPAAPKDKASVLPVVGLGIIGFLAVGGITWAALRKRQKKLPSSTFPSAQPAVSSSSAPNSSQPQVATPTPEINERPVDSSPPKIQ